MTTIKFGTDGWRAIIADAFTFENVRVIAQAVSNYILSINHGERGLAISYDVRFLSQQFARTMAEVISSNGIPVFLSQHFTPTPVLSFAVSQRQLAGGIMITASHNPYYYNGVKFKGEYGGPAMIGLTQAIENQLHRNQPRHDEALIQRNLHVVDFVQEYVLHLRRFLNWDLIHNFDAVMVYDAMHGAGCHVLHHLLSQAAGRLVRIRNMPDPMFGQALPEPIPKNLAPLMRAVVRHHAAVGLATDGDADRFGIVDSSGHFVDLHDLMPLLFSYLIESRHWSGDVVRTTSMANTIDRLAAKHGRKVWEVPVGFKHVTETMLENNIMIGGEESGGFGYRDHIPERDGILSCLLVVEMLAAKKQPIQEMVAQLRQEFGPFAYGRIDEYSQPEIMAANMAALRNSPPERIGDFVVDSVLLIDGIKFYFTDHSWMLIRVSQTEPLARVYVAADCHDKVTSLLQQGVQLITRTR
ncbi:MAG: phosphoglucomutase/phosphomannomutase family protein [candidate division KSB1 bacterium]|nr:phosphoglucomutase/phosphomannomutase family protein [candidate division KSB1 bacterium]MDZ7341525.1 phosphoglucomutase/phosphomannomutase family protein [candidate division KSB1 bacterium]